LVFGGMEGGYQWHYWGVNTNVLIVEVIRGGCLVRRTENYADEQSLFFCILSAYNHGCKLDCATICLLIIHCHTL
jgi:hypothetical protein